MSDEQHSNISGTTRLDDSAFINRSKFGVGVCV